MQILGEEKEKVSRGFKQSMAWFGLPCVTGSGGVCLEAADFAKRFEWGDPRWQRSK